MDGAVGDNNGFADVKKLMNTYEKGGGHAVELEQKIEVKHELKGQMGDVFLTL